MNKLTYTFGAVWSAMLTIVGLVVLILVAEASAPTKLWLSTNFSHHWVGKGILATAFFLIASLVIAACIPKKHKVELRDAVLALFWTATIGSIALFIFFLWHSLS